jgi:hypothetical protein
MSAVRHWLAFRNGPRGLGGPEVLVSEKDARDYRAMGYLVDGPFVLDAAHGAVARDDVEQMLKDVSSWFAGDHVNAGVVVGQVRKRLRDIPAAGGGS